MSTHQVLIMLMMNPRVGILLGQNYSEYSEIDLQAQIANGTIKELNLLLNQRNLNRLREKYFMEYMEVGRKIYGIISRCKNAFHAKIPFHTSQPVK